MTENSTNNESNVDGSVISNHLQLDIIPSPVSDRAFYSTASQRLAALYDIYSKNPMKMDMARGFLTYAHCSFKEEIKKMFGGLAGEGHALTNDAQATCELTPTILQNGIAEKCIKLEQSLGELSEEGFISDELNELLDKAISSSGKCNASTLTNGYANHEVSHSSDEDGERSADMFTPQCSPRLENKKCTSRCSSPEQSDELITTEDIALVEKLLSECKVNPSAEKSVSQNDAEREKSASHCELDEHVTTTKVALPTDDECASVPEKEELQCASSPEKPSSQSPSMAEKEVSLCVETPIQGVAQCSAAMGVNKSESQCISNHVVQKSVTNPVAKCSIVPDVVPNQKSNVSSDSEIVDYLRCGVNKTGGCGPHCNSFKSFGEKIEISVDSKRMKGAQTWANGVTNKFERTPNGFTAEYKYTDIRSKDKSHSTKDGKWAKGKGDKKKKRYMKITTEERFFDANEFFSKYLSPGADPTAISDELRSMTASARSTNDRKDKKNCSKPTRTEFEYEPRWLMVSTFFREVFRTVLRWDRPSNDIRCNVDLMNRLAVQDPYQFYLRLEDSVRECIQEIMFKQLELLSFFNEKDGPLFFVFCMMEFYNKLMFAAASLAPLLLSLELDHLVKHKLRWYGVNRYLYFKIVFSDSRIQHVLPYCISKIRFGKRGEEHNSKALKLLLGYIEEMLGVSAFTVDIEKSLMKYHNCAAAVEAYMKITNLKMNIYRDQLERVFTELNNNVIPTQPLVCPDSDYTDSEWCSCLKCSGENKRYFRGRSFECCISKMKIMIDAYKSCDCCTTHFSHYISACQGAPNYETLVNPSPCTGLDGAEAEYPRSCMGQILKAVPKQLVENGKSQPTKVVTAPKESVVDDEESSPPSAPKSSNGEVHRTLYRKEVIHQQGLSKNQRKFLQKEASKDFLPKQMHGNQHLTNSQLGELRTHMIEHMMQNDGKGAFGSQVQFRVTKCTDSNEVCGKYCDDQCQQRADSASDGSTKSSNSCKSSTNSSTNDVDDGKDPNNQTNGFQLGTWYNLSTLEAAEIGSLRNPKVVMNDKVADEILNGLSDKIDTAVKSESSASIPTHEKCEELVKEDCKKVKGNGKSSSEDKTKNNVGTSNDKMVSKESNVTAKEIVGVATSDKNKSSDPVKTLPDVAADAVNSIDKTATSNIAVPDTVCASSTTVTSDAVTMMSNSSETKNQNIKPLQTLAAAAIPSSVSITLKPTDSLETSASETTSTHTVTVSDPVDAKKSAQKTSTNVKAVATTAVNSVSTATSSTGTATCSTSTMTDIAVDPCKPKCKDAGKSSCKPIPACKSAPTACKSASAAFACTADSKRPNKCCMMGSYFNSKKMKGVQESHCAVKFGHSTTTANVTGVGAKTTANSTTQTCSRSTAINEDFLSYKASQLPEFVKTTAIAALGTVCPRHGSMSSTALPLFHSHGATDSDEDDSLSDLSDCHQRHCDCCYCEVYGSQSAPVSRTFNKTRERLRSLLRKKNKELGDVSPACSKAVAAAPVPEASPKVVKPMKEPPQQNNTRQNVTQLGLKPIDELLDFIEGNKSNSANSKRLAKQMRKKQRQEQEEERKRKEEEEEAERKRLEELRRQEEEEARRIAEEKRQRELSRMKNKKKGGKQAQESAPQASKKNKKDQKANNAKSNQNGTESKKQQNNQKQTVIQKQSNQQIKKGKETKASQPPPQSSKKECVQAAKQSKTKGAKVNGNSSGVPNDVQVNGIKSKPSKKAAPEPTPAEPQQPQIVTIRRIIPADCSEPTVTFTLRGNTPKDDKQLYPIPGQPTTTKQTEKSKKTPPPPPPVVKPPPPPPPVAPKSPVLRNSCLTGITDRLERLDFGPQPVANNASANELTTPTAIQINQAVHQLSTRPSFPNNFDLQNIKLPPGITITKVDPATVQRKPIQVKQQASPPPPPPQPQAHIRQQMMQQAQPSNVIVVGAGIPHNQFGRQVIEEPMVNGGVPAAGKKKRRRRKKEGAAPQDEQQFALLNGYAAPSRLGPIGTPSMAPSMAPIGTPAYTPFGPSGAGTLYGGGYTNGAADFRTAHPPAIIQNNGGMVTIRNPAIYPQAFAQPGSYYSDTDGEISKYWPK